jgi:hypothetical protein
LAAAAIVVGLIARRAAAEFRAESRVAMRKIAPA